MLKPTDHFHGSDLEKIESLYQIRKEDIVSFSANVNPLGLSEQFKQRLAQKLDVITSYPDREYTRLRTAIGNYCGTDSRHIIVGNGSTELISLMIQLRCPKKAMILGPTYSEYEREVTLNGGSCFYFPLEEALDFVPDVAKLTAALCEDIDLLILCNPNNPTSSVITTQQMRQILDTCRQLNIFIMVDETYIEFVSDTENVSAVPLTTDYDNLVILRGVSKFFAAPGLRLGYAVTGSDSLLRTISEKQNPWTVSSIADTAGQLLFEDKDYILKTRKLISSERDRIQTLLSETDGLKAYPAHANFVLVRSLRKDVTAADLFDTAIRQGLMIRNCSTFAFLDESYFRFCYMKPEDNDRLISCIREVFSR